jgi:CxxC motif-containing protein (DUF1111 family)
MVLLALSGGCDKSPRFTQAEPGEALSAGSASINDQSASAFSFPSNNLTPAQRLDFSVGNSFFRNPWVIAPSSTTARDGLGPLFNINACQSCHLNDGRGHPPGPNATNAFTMLVRLSIPGGPEDQETRQKLGVVPEPTYGGQLQDNSIPGIPPEGKVRFDYTESQVTFKDGTVITLRKPTLRIENPGYGPFHPQTQFSARIAPPMIGLGLLEAIPESAILANADPNDESKDGISGTANWVWSFAEQKTMLGRFGWKAGQPTLDQQNATAFSGDMGLTSNLIDNDDCTSAQIACKQAPNGGDPEVSDNIRRLVLFYTRNVGVPVRRGVDQPSVLQGKTLFHVVGCVACHTSTFKTDSHAVIPELANQVIHPYTDLLLHDMGEGLADNRSEFLANGREWRTPPLWGIGLTQKVSGHTQFLHDGRARNTLEAILWHGGEAEAAKQRVLALDADERSALLDFLNSL